MREASPARAANTQTTSPNFPPLPPTPNQNQNSDEQARPDRRIQKWIKRAFNFKGGKGKTFGKPSKGKGKTKGGKRPPWKRNEKGKGKTKK